MDITCPCSGRVETGRESWSHAVSVSQGEGPGWIVGATSQLQLPCYLDLDDLILHL